MHEMSIAVSIIDIVVEQAQKADAGKINSVVLELGSLSGVTADALQFCFSSAAKSTIADNAALEIIEYKAKAICDSCNFEFNTDQLVPVCPECDELVINVQGGREMQIKSINVD
jgi:hydrogenase nickel incorporation protein HypA/HybF